MLPGQDLHAMLSMSTVPTPLCCTVQLRIQLQQHSSTGWVHGWVRLEVMLPERGDHKKAAQHLSSYTTAVSLLWCWVAVCHECSIPLILADISGSFPLSSVGCCACSGEKRKSVSSVPSKILWDKRQDQQYCPVKKSLGKRMSNLCYKSCLWKFPLYKEFLLSRNNS